VTAYKKVHTVVKIPGIQELNLNWDSGLPF